MNKINFYISNKSQYENIYDDNVKFDNNTVSILPGKIKNKFARKIIEMDYISNFYLRNIKKI